MMGRTCPEGHRSEVSLLSRRSSHFVNLAAQTFEPESGGAGSSNQKATTEAGAKSAAGFPARSKRPAL